MAFSLSKKVCQIMKIFNIDVRPRFTTSQITKMSSICLVNLMKISYESFKLYKDRFNGDTLQINNLKLALVLHFIVAGLKLEIYMTL